MKFSLQEILQVHLDQEFRRPKHQNRWLSSLFDQRGDGPKEVLQPPLSLPLRLRGSPQTAQRGLRGYQHDKSVRQIDAVEDHVEKIAGGQKSGAYLFTSEKKMIGFFCV